MTFAPKIGLALGGGGVRGLAHIGLLKLLDKHSITPSMISGTSIGAIIGALYAHGVSGQEIESRVREHIIEPTDKLNSIYKKRSNLRKWTKVFKFERSRGGVVKADGLFKHLFDELIDISFDQLKIPFVACATDYHSGTECALRSGALLPAVQASMAVPGVFAPVSLDVNGKPHLLVDGGLVNNLPTSHIQMCDIKIASDVISMSPNDAPKTLDLINGAINIMIMRATASSLAAHPADIVNRVDTSNLDAFDFHKIDDVLKRGDHAAQALEPSVLKQLEIHSAQQR